MVVALEGDTTLPKIIRKDANTRMNLKYFKSFESTQTFILM